MLSPDSRAVLLDQLRPPPGYELQHAVGTTFTLDLGSALIPPLAFASKGLSAAADQIALLTSVRSAADKIDVFCQAGHIAVPRNASRLFAFLEDVVHQVSAPRPGHLFHPKIWFLQYVGDSGDLTYRLLIQSRNLTPDTSWDTVVTLDGIAGTKPISSNRPLAALLTYLPTVTRDIAQVRRDRIAALASNIRYVDWQKPDGATDMAFHVLGLPDRLPKPSFIGYRSLIVSPFLTDGGLKRVSNDQMRDVTVVSRVESLEGLSPVALKTLKSSLIVNALAGLEVPEEAEAGPDPANILSGLHAKMFISERNSDNGPEAHLFLGSANATDGAFAGNIEVMVELIGKRKELGIDAMLKDDSLGAILEPYAAVGGQEADPNYEAQWRLEQVLRDLASIQILGIVSHLVDGFQVQLLTSDPIEFPAGYEVTMEMHTRPGSSYRVERGAPLDLLLSPMPASDISGFLTVRVTSPEGLDGSTLLMISLQNDPPERLTEILAQQLDTPEKFLKFILMLLGIESGSLFSMLAAGQGENGAKVRITPSGLFEALLRALSDSPRALDGLGDLIELLSRDPERAAVLPDGLAELWPEIEEAQRLLLAGRTS